MQREEERNLHSRTGPTLDDLCRAAAELERIDSRNGMKEINSAASKKHRPGNISIPSHSSPLLHHHDRQKLTSFSPPYTPPPILSPSRSMTMLSNITSGGPATPQVPCTPNKIWQRKGKLIFRRFFVECNTCVKCYTELYGFVVYHKHTYCKNNVCNDQCQHIDNASAHSLLTHLVFHVPGSERVSESEDSFSYTEP